MKSEGWKGGIFFSFSFYKKENGCLLVIHGKRKQFSFIRMNISFFVLVIRFEIWDGWEGQLKNAETFFFFIGRVSFPFFFFWLNAIFSWGYGEILAALDR